MEQTHRHAGQTHGGQRGEMEWESGVSRGKVSHREGMSNKVLLSSIGNYSQYPGINHEKK